MRNRSVWLLALALGALTCASACTGGGGTGGGGGATARHKKGPNEPVYIGFSMDTLKEERWQRDKELVEKRAKELGAEIYTQVANGDDAEQIRQAENLL